MSASIEKELVEFVECEILNETLTADDDLLATGLIDSMGIMRLIAHLEDRYQVTVPPEDVTIENFRALTSVASYVEGRLRS